MLQRRPPIDDSRWLYLTLAAWVGLQAASLAYGRAVGIIASRYLDIYTVLAVLNLASLLMLTRGQVGPAGSGLASLLAAAGWVIVVVVSYGAAAISRVPSEVAYRAEMSAMRPQTCAISSIRATSATWRTSRFSTYLIQPLQGLPSFPAIPPSDRYCRLRSCYKM